MYVKVVALHCHIVWPLNVPTFFAVFGPSTNTTSNFSTRWTRSELEIEILIEVFVMKKELSLL